MDWLQRQRIYQECMEFLFHEADLLDQHRYEEWSELLTDDIIYKVPIRVSREKQASSEFSQVAYHMDEDRGSMNLRVKRHFSEYNWAEDPVSRTRHFVSNFKVDSIDENGEEVKARTNLLMYRQKFDATTYNLLSGERHDTLRKENGKWKLAKRVVYLDHTTIPMQNMALFF